MSALRGRYRPTCGDLFADVDLSKCCPVTAVNDYPRGLEDVARAAPPGPWMYTGALENHPALVERISATRPCHGNRGQALRRIRDPLIVEQVLRGAGLSCPAARSTGAGLPRDGTWLRKRRRSSGGLHVQVWDAHVDAPEDDPAWYFQERVLGIPCAAIYLSAAGRARLLGATEQCLGQAGLEFRYAGSLGPLSLSPTLAASLDRLGDVLADRFRLVGLFGVDYVFDGTAAWPVEINPRYTASMEVLERAIGLSLVAWHVEACLAGSLPDRPQVPSGRQYAKRTLYARAEITVPADFVGHALELNRREAWPVVADIPRPSTRVRRGRPLLTILAEASDRAAVEEALRERALELEWRLYGR